MKEFLGEMKSPKNPEWDAATKILDILGKFPPIKQGSVLADVLDNLSQDIFDNTREFSTSGVSISRKR